MLKQRLRTISYLTGVLAVVAASAGAQVSVHKLAKKTSKATPKAVAPVPPKAISVVVFPVDLVGGDSIRVMVSRDLDNGDRVVPAFLDPAIIAASAPIGSDSRGRVGPSPTSIGPSKNSELPPDSHATPL